MLETSDKIQTQTPLVSLNLLDFLFAKRSDRADHH